MAEMAGGSEELLQLATDVQPAQADHSFAGVVFDVATLSDWEATLRSFHVAGQLGTVSVYAARDGWCDTGDLQRAVARSGWGNANDMIDSSRWDLVARARHSPSWNACVEIVLDRPVRILPGSVAGIYIHSNIENDGGLIYQSCARSDALGGDDHITILPGLGHTSSTPFGTEDGWWASSRARMRGLAGAVTYTVRRRFWSVAEAEEMPLSLRKAVRVLLLCHARGGNALSILPKVLVHAILEYCSWSWFTQPEVVEQTSPSNQPVTSGTALPKAQREEHSELASNDSVSSEEEVVLDDGESTLGDDQLVESERQAWLLEGMHYQTFGLCTSR